MKFYRIAMLGALVVFFMARLAAAQQIGGFGAPSIGNIDSGVQGLQGLASVRAVQTRAAAVVTPSDCEERYRSFAVRNGMSPSRRRAEARLCLEAAKQSEASSVAQSD